MSREQKTVLRLGINGRLISSKEIFESVGIVSEDYYRQLIESLRDLGVLRNKLNSAQVNTQKKKYRNSRKAVPRYEIVLPNESQTTPEKNVNIDTSDYAKIFIENLDYSTTEEELEVLFTQFGEVSDVYIYKDRHTGKSRGIAALEFEQKESRKKALEFNKPLILTGRKLFVKTFMK